MHTAPKNSLAEMLAAHQSEYCPLLPVERTDAVRLDLSKDNQEFQQIDKHNTEELYEYIWRKIEESGAAVGVGGYIEHRRWYQKAELFTDEDGEHRTVHIGVDLWMDSDTPISCPLEGRVHSFQNNAGYGDYGPTIILSHQLEGITFHTLYGHLSLESLSDKKDGQRIEAGQVFAKMGEPAINGNWPPHVHFQIIANMQGKRGDYPAVVAESKLGFYLQNCPDPNLLLNIPVLQSS